MSKKFLIGKSSISEEEAYKSLREQITNDEKKPGLNQYYKIDFRICFSKDNKEKPMYCFSTTVRDSNIVEF